VLYLALLIGIVLIVATTKITEAFNKSSNWLLIVQIGVSFVIIMYGDFEVSYFDFIYGNQMELGHLAIPFSLLYIIGFTNVMNIEKSQNPLILLLPCITLICLSIYSYIIGNTFVSNIGIMAILIVIVLLIGSLLRKILIGKTIITAICFIISVLSLSLVKFSLLTIYIPISTVAIPFILYEFFQNKTTSRQSITISGLIAILFGSLMFIVSSHVIWYLIFGLTIILVIMQFSHKYRFI
jgi:UDP-GlcNAc:undecaprenyl-phosphate/decaprenyl-phosphate GlcNAc-1-phosphate transferase